MPNITASATGGAMPAAAPTSRRGFLGALTAAPALAVPAVAMAAPGTPDPIFAAIEKHRRLLALGDEIYVALEAAESKVDEPRPFALIAWRRYSHIGGSEIERARDEFLDAGFDPVLIESEYRDARLRYRALVDAEEAWDARHGIAPLRRQDRDLRKLQAASTVYTTVPQTKEGALALIEHFHKDMDGCAFEEEPTEMMLDSISAWLKREAADV
ncbi:Tat (twin-arginine translocation) pathway signal sequence [Rhizobiales bacterium GAS191]|nr:Tat (twin-arginine translocation) pathway signal sequence [Rhizobiales bacterium GAS191]